MRNFSVIISSVLLFSCTSNLEQESKGFTLKGRTQGTTYAIIVAEDQLHFQPQEIDHLLAAFDSILSTYISTSEISRLNASKQHYSFKDTRGFFRSCYTKSQEIYKVSNHLFDPSIYPLVEAWGFYHHSEIVPDQKQIDSLLSFISFEPNQLHSIEFSGDSVHFSKKDPRFKLDFNAIAQGYAVDVVADYIQSKGHTNYYVEIGGEVRVSGTNSSGEKWKIGIDTPADLEERESMSTLEVTNCGIATSGNYRNYFEKEGKKYGHILSAVSGYPEQTDVLSSTVIHSNAALADAYATVFMLLGKEKSIQLCDQHPEIKLLLVYLDEKNTISIFKTSNFQ